MQNQEKNRKNVKRKNNFLQEVTNLQNILTKTRPFDKNVNEIDSNLNGSATDRKDEIIINELSSTTDEKDENGKCSCFGRVWLEDPNDPRGCIYFQV